MKAIVCLQPGQLEYAEIAPPALKPGHAIIRIKNICICGTDLHAFEGTQPYFSYPRILGHELSGELVDFDAAPGFTRGDAVTFLPYFNCGHCAACRAGKENCCVDLKVCGVHIDGGMVEYLSVPSRLLVQGQGLGYRDLAMIEPLAIGAHGVARAQVKTDETVLVVGAGPIGLGAMQMASIAGAHVVALDKIESRLTFSKAHTGAHDTVNARDADVVDQLRALTGGEMFDVVIDATGSQAAINGGLAFLAHGGRYVLIGLQKGDLVFSHPEFHKREATLMSSRNATRRDFEQVIGLIKSGLINPKIYINNEVHFNDVKEAFPTWLHPSSGIIKTVVETGF